MCAYSWTECALFLGDDGATGNGTVIVEGDMELLPSGDGVMGILLRSVFGNALEKVLSDIGVPLSITEDLLTLTQPLSLDNTAYASPDLISAAGRLSQSTNISTLSDIASTSNSIVPTDGHPKRISDHLNNLALSVVASLDVPLGRGEAGVPRQLLDITK